ncbi:hypothetical protein FRC04_008961 [Tulasnella sp. 424]|nr:hypothetical protein FRC04_008961 [Tulasnella sp. 424]KAG8973617.1 hypothetical protein FRC05_008553 [Tulasnella sp. 425]
MPRIPRRGTSGPGGQDGVVVDLTMQGDGLYHCVYTVPAQVGTSQTQFQLQVDTGSSDTWLASTSCTSKPSCSTFTGPKYDASSAQSTGQKFDVTYQRGTVQGPIVLDAFQVGGYSIAKQALASASDIENEVLSTGSGFTGLIGLAPQANSIIAQEVDDSPTVLTHLLSNSTSNDDTGLTSTPPSKKFVSLLLERPFYPGYASKLGIGRHPDELSSQASNIQYSPISPSNPGPLYWRTPVTKVAIDLAGETRYMPLGSTEATSVSSIYPVAILDSGGVSMISTRSFANAFYGTWGIGPGQQDGQYYVPCQLAMNVTLTLGSNVSIDVPIHPLDMSMAIPTEPGSSTCLGALQATDSDLTSGDLILGPAFMRNIYTVLSYETDPPQLGILPLTNAATAYQEFNTVRVLKQTITPVNADMSTTSTSTSAGASQSPESDNKSTMIGVKVIVAIVVFLIVAGLGIFFGVRLMQKRWKKQAEEEANAPDARPRDMAISGKEKRAHAGRSVFGLEIDEAFTMFGASANGAGPSGANGGGASDIGHGSQEGPPKPARRLTRADLVINQPGDSDEDRSDDHSHPTPVAQRRQTFKRAPESSDYVWGNGSMSGLLQQHDGRYPSVYSVGSLGASMRNGSDSNMRPMEAPNNEWYGSTLPQTPNSANLDVPMSVRQVQARSSAEHLIEPPSPVFKAAEPRQRI